MTFKEKKKKKTPKPGVHLFDWRVSVHCNGSCTMNSALFSLHLYHSCLCLLLLIGSPSSYV